MATTMTPMSVRHHDAPFTSHRTYDTALSPADTLPSVDFNFADLRERMALFTARFDDFIARGRARVLAERNNFRLSHAEAQETARARKASIARLAAETSEAATLRAREAAEASELESATSALRQEHAAAVTRRDALVAEIRSVQEETAGARAAAGAKARKLEGQARLNGPECRFWERGLGMRIEGAGRAERLRFVFCCVDTRDADREVGFVLDLGAGQEGYKVEETWPQLEGEEVDAVVEGLNEGGELAGFLKGMRTLFVQAVNDR